MPGRIFCAMRSGIWVSSFSTGSCSTTSVQRSSFTLPSLRSMKARMSFSCPYLARPAFWMACSIASSTSSRSIIFSRATASATCSSSGRAMATSRAMVPSSPYVVAAVAAMSSSVSTSLARRMLPRGKRISGAVLQPQPRRLGVGAHGDPLEALAPFQRHHELHLRDVAGVALPVLGAGQRPVDAGGGDLQRPFAADRVLDIEHGADRVADRLAILDPEGVAIGAVGHDLHHRPFLAADLHPHELVAHVLDGGGHGVGDARLQPLVLRTFDAARHGSRPRESGPKTKKAAPGRATFRGPDGVGVGSDIGDAAAPDKAPLRAAPAYLRRRLRRPHRPRQVPRREGLRDVVRQRVGHRLLRLPPLQQQNAEIGQRRQAFARRQGPEARRQP